MYKSISSSPLADVEMNGFVAGDVTCQPGSLWARDRGCPSKISLNGLVTPTFRVVKSKIEMILVGTFVNN